MAKAASSKGSKGKPAEEPSVRTPEEEALFQASQHHAQLRTIEIQAQTVANQVSELEQQVDTLTAERDDLQARLSAAEARATAAEESQKKIVAKTIEVFAVASRLTQSISMKLQSCRSRPKEPEGGTNDK